MPPYIKRFKLYGGANDPWGADAPGDTGYLARVGDAVTFIIDADDTFYWRYYASEPSAGQEPLGTASSTNYRAYPHNDMHTDGYYYVRDVYVWERYQRYVSSHTTADETVDVPLSPGVALLYASDYFGFGYGVAQPDDGPYINVPPFQWNLTEPVTRLVVRETDAALAALLDRKYWRLEDGETDELYYGATGVMTGGGGLAGVTRQYQVPVYSVSEYISGVAVCGETADAYPENGTAEGTTTPVYRLVP